MTSSVWVAGVDELNRLEADLAGSGERASRAIHNTLRKTAADISRDAKSFAPVDTGNLRSSIGWDYSRVGDVSEAVIGPTAEYGAFVEFGTSSQAPQAYMGPALDRNAPGFVEAMGQIAEQVIAGG